MLVFDIETDGLLDNLTHIKCLNMLHTPSGREYRFTDHEHYEEPYPNLETGELCIYAGTKTKRDGTIADGLALLADASSIGGQNVIAFDIPAIRKVFPSWDYAGVVWDTLTMSRVMYTNLFDLDMRASKAGRLPPDFASKRLIGTHKLEAWGLRLGGEQKADFNPKDYGQTWDSYSFSEACDDYCMQDVRTNAAVFEHFLGKGYSDQCIRLEHDVAEIIYRQEAYGWAFDVDAAEKLTATLLIRKQELMDDCTKAFEPWYVKVRFRQGRNNKKFGTVKDADWNQINWIEFNPTSRDHIANRLQKVKGWRPKDFTPNGKPKVDDAILNALPYPEAKLLAELFMVTKRLGQIAEGKQAWLKKVKPDGRIHGRVNSNGAVTGRMTHSDPNVAQCPANYAPYGEECRACWTVGPGRKLVGADADGLELRMLANRLFKYDNGAYAKTVVEGNKADGTDAHTLNQEALKFSKRDNAKAWIYAFLYGAGNYKLGTIVLADFDEERRARFLAKFPAGRQRDKAITQLGETSRSRLESAFPALATFVDKLKKFAKRNGYLKGLDGRRIHVRSEHAALNSQLQSDGAVVMKQALVLLDQDLEAQGYAPGDDYEFVGNIHDEVQIECREEIATDVAERASASIRRAGEVLGVHCPLAGAADIGNNWAETH
ncbi:MAG: DNA polymerase [Planctomycetota bacterium]